MVISRKDFCNGLLGGSAVLLFPGCGGGSDYGGSPAPAPTPAPAACGATGAAISGNHGHVLTVPRADLDSATDMNYSIAGTAGHDHTFTLTVAQLQALKAGQTVTVTTGTTNAHSHQVTPSCS